MLDLAPMQAKHPENHDDLLPVGKAARLAGISRDTIKRWERAGRITSRRLPNGHRRYRRGDVEALLTQDISA